MPKMAIWCGCHFGLDGGPKLALRFPFSEALKAPKKEKKKISKEIRPKMVLFR